MKHREPVVALGILCLAACSRTRGTAEKDTPRAVPSPSSSVPPSVVLDYVDAGKIAPERPPSPFGILAEGPCPELDVEVVESAAFIHYGHYAFFGEGAKPELVTIARVKEDGALDVDPSLVAGLPDAGHPTDFVLPMDLVSIRGSWPDAMTLTIFGEGGERVGARTATFVWDKDHRWKTADDTTPWDDREWPWLNGSTLKLTRRKVVDAGAVTMADAHFVVTPAHATYTPDFTGLTGCKDFSLGDSEILVRPGEILMAGNCALELQGSRMFPTDPAILRWSKSTPSRVRIPAAMSFDIQRAKALELEDDGTLWARSYNALYRRSADGTWDKQLDKVSSVAFHDHKPAWAVNGTSGTLYRRMDDGTFAPQELPRPAFSTTATLRASRVLASDAGDTWVVASYAEKRPAGGQAESRTALLRLGAHHAPMRCDGGFAGWPPPATDDCATPVALLARLSKSAPRGYDFPQTRKALRGHTELEGTQFIEIELAGQRFLAARVRSLGAGQTLVGLVAAGVKGTRPELVCATPKVTREVAIDLATGTLQP